LVVVEQLTQHVCSVLLRTVLEIVRSYFAWDCIGLMSAWLVPWGTDEVSQSEEVNKVTYQKESTLLEF